MKQNRLCYISRNYYNLTSAGNKAKTDNEDTLDEMGAVNLGLHRTVRNSKIIAFFLDLAGILRACLLLQKGDTLFLQYPVKKYFSFLCKIARMKGAKTVSLIHDLGSFRRKKLTVEKEISRLSHSDYIIASNENMKKWLKEHGMQKPVGALGLFDYHSASPCQEKASDRKQPKVVYAGALSMKKNSFLVELSKTLTNWQLLVCGNKEGLQGLKENPLITYQGFVPSEDFIKSIDADFGLVWDGDSLDTCSGEYGQYLKWNSPHKVSFYLRAHHLERSCRSSYHRRSRSRYCYQFAERAGQNPCQSHPRRHRKSEAKCKTPGRKTEPWALPSPSIRHLFLYPSAMLTVWDISN